MNKQLKHLQGKIRKSMAVLFFLLAGIQIAIVNTYATSGNANIDTVTAPINNLKLILEAIVSVIGIIIVIYNISKLGPAISSHDNSGIAQAVSGIAGGAIMAAVSTVLAILGLS